MRLLAEFVMLSKSPINSSTNFFRDPALLHFSIGTHDFIEKYFHVAIPRLRSLDCQCYQHGASSSRRSLSESKNGAKVCLAQRSIHETKGAL
jgi:hypothetical protein